MVHQYEKRLKVLERKIYDLVSFTLAIILTKLTFQIRNLKGPATGQKMIDGLCSCSLLIYVVSHAIYSVESNSGKTSNSKRRQMSKSDLRWRLRLLRSLPLLLRTAGGQNESILVLTDYSTSSSIEEFQDQIITVIRHCPNVEVFVVERSLGSSFGSIMDALARYGSLADTQERPPCPS